MNDFEEGPGRNNILQVKIKDNEAISKICSQSENKIFIYLTHSGPKLPFYFSKKIKNLSDIPDKVKREQVPKIN